VQVRVDNPAHSRTQKVQGPGRHQVEPACPPQQSTLLRRSPPRKKSTQTCTGQPGNSPRLPTERSIRLSRDSTPSGLLMSGGSWRT
jgi:hypothetical protein